MFIVTEPAFEIIIYKDNYKITWNSWDFYTYVGGRGLQGGPWKVLCLPFRSAQPQNSLTLHKYRQSTQME